MKKNTLVTVMILLLGFFIFFIIFFNSYKNFKHFYDYSLNGLIESIKETKTGVVFKLKDNYKYYDFYLDKSNEEFIVIGDSISKKTNDKEINIYRIINGEMTLVNSLYISESKMFYDYIVDTK